MLMRQSAFAAQCPTDRATQSPSVLSDDRLEISPVGPVELDRQPQHRLYAD
jgi:hypothetical protein